MPHLLFLGLLRAPAALAVENCQNALDDDADGLSDCIDVDCGLDPACCPAGPIDPDADGWCLVLDNCPLHADPLHGDVDGDGIGDACDGCPGATGDGTTLFGYAVALSPPVSDTWLTLGADVDGDGAIDVITGSDSTEPLQWYGNLGGGVFGAAATISPLVGDVDALDVGDLDGDGDPDVVAARFSTGLAWYENLGGVFSAHPMGAAARATEVVALDADGDGDLDVAAADGLGTDVWWVENLGGGLFPAEAALAAVDAPVALSTGDLDGDGLPDLVVGSDGGDAVVWVPNLGGGAFGPPALVAPLGSVPIATAAADVDGDGDLDVVAGACGGAGLVVAENLGGGVFGLAEPLGALSCVSALAVLDTEGDGDLDVVAEEYPVGLQWLENDGTGGFTARDDGPGYTNFSPMRAADLDDDGLADLLTARSWRRNQAACALLDTDGDGLHDADEIVTHGTDPALRDSDGDGLDDGTEVDDLGTNPNADDSDGDAALDGVDLCPLVPDPAQADGDADGTGDACDPCAGDQATGDLDEDRVCDDLDACTGDDASGDTDLDGWCDDRDGCPADADPLQEDLDLDGVGDPCDACAGDDATGDADADLLCSDLDNCDFVPNADQADADADGAGDACDVCAAPGDGVGLFGPGVPLPPQVTAVVPADLDGDGATDLVLGTWDDEIWWSRNLGAGVFDPAVPIFALSPTGGAVVTVVLAVGDLDGDGDPDVVASTTFDDQLSWAENLGSGVFGAPTLIDFTAEPVTGIALADLDLDADLDVLVGAGLGSGAVVAFLNTAGSFTAQNVTTGAGGPALATADLDVDGLVDVLAGAITEYGWIRNTGAGVFGALQALSPVLGADSLAGADLDGDGVPDLAFARFQELGWRRGLGAGAFGPEQILPTELNVDYPEHVHAADVDLDGDLDVLASGASVWWFDNVSGAFGSKQAVSEASNAWFSWGILTADLDADGWPDAVLTDQWFPNLGSCALSDSDADGLRDAEELVLHGTDPLVADTDGDGSPDGDELAAGTDPLDPTDGLAPPDTGVAPPDTGLLPDTGPTPTDTGVTPTDTGPAPSDSDLPGDTTSPRDTGPVPVDPGADPAPEGCGCRSAPTPEIPWAVVGLLAAAAARRRVGPAGKRLTPPARARG